MSSQSQEAVRSRKSDFQFLSKIGVGSYGSVWKAMRRADSLTYAIKELDMRAMSHKERVDCAAEAKVLSSLQSPYIIRYFDSFIDEDFLYIVTEFASSGTLHSLISQAKGPLSEDVVWRLLIQIVLGLHHMHQSRILHRDVKSQNIFLEGKQVKIGDLGVARHMSTHTCFAKTVIGTPYYLSPELCEDRPYNQKSDVWALGVVLYECCTGKHPFDGQSQAALIMKILRGQYRPVTGYSAELADIVKRCLTQSTARRPDTARLLSLPSIQSKAKTLGISLPEDSPQPGKRSSRPNSPALSPQGSPMTSPAASIQLVGRAACRDDMPLRPPASLAAVQPQRQLRVMGAPVPRPASRSQDQPLAQYARNNAFVAPAAASKLLRPVQQANNALPGGKATAKQAALDALRERSLRRRSFNMSKNDEEGGPSRPQSAHRLRPLRIPNSRRRSEDGACTPSSAKGFGAGNNVDGQAGQGMRQGDAAGLGEPQPGSSDKPVKAAGASYAGRGDMLRARIAAARERCRELIGAEAFAEAHKSLQAQAHGDTFGSPFESAAAKSPDLVAPQVNAIHLDDHP
ncbi:hypothetical protein WJX84_001961 [Apatococcus fuscideae]|uniref:non-specific serine/threonine protein kinase n=1 Tax=Apatococcus fuscideae TaxID=2026836 RepID=A0AAW1TH30_9CHLO